MRDLIRASMIGVCALLVSGCSGIGPKMIGAGRPVYNEAIVATNNEQILDLIVRTRYVEPAGLLAVSSVTANMRVRATIGADFGFGPEDNYSGNLVPLSAGALYEDNPTISYTPVQGMKHLHEQLSPLPLELTILLLNAVGDSPAAVEILIEEINGVHNARVVPGATIPADPRFAEIAELMASLRSRGQLLWSHEEAESKTTSLVLRGDLAESDEEIDRLCELLGVRHGGRRGDIRVIPVVFGVGARDGTRIAIMTRSPYSLVKLAAASIDIPDQHYDAGFTVPVVGVESINTLITIQRAASRPADALVAVEHRGWWFYVDGADLRSKAAFRLIQAVVTARMADTARGNASTPVLTVPVSR